MPRHLRVRIGLVLVVVAVSLWYLYPLKSAINLGLDLQGGIHLMLGVEADRHVASQTDRAAEDLKSALERKGIAVKRIAREGNTAIRVELASPQSWNDARTVVSEFTSFDRRDDDHAPGLRSDPDPAAGNSGRRARQGPHRQDRAARVQAARRAHAGRSGAGRPSPGDGRVALRTRGRQADQGRAQGPVRGAEAEPADRRRADAGRRLGRPELDGQLAGRDRVHLD